MSMHRSFSLPVGVLWPLVFMLSVCANAQAQGEWYCTHGNAGNIEYINRVDTLDRVHIGWGLDFQQKSGLTNWIHFAVPTIHQLTSRYIALEFYTGSVDAIVEQVDVYNLSQKVKSFNDLDLAGGWFLEVLDMGSDIPFSAVGISVKVGAGVEMMSHRFLFTGACAYLE
jgi:hypothetical protein